MASSQVRITRACNQRCPFCNTNESAPDFALEPAEVRSRLEAIRASGGGEVTFTGGEPTLVGELATYLGWSRELGLRVAIQTNAVRLAERSFTRDLRRASPARLLVSLHSPDPATADELTGSEGDLERTLAGIVAALDERFEVGTNTVICRSNQDQLCDLVELVHQRSGRRVREMVFSFQAPVAAGLRDIQRMARVADVLPELQRALARCRELGVIGVIPGICGAPVCALGPVAPYADELRRPAPGPLPVDRTYLPGCDRCAHRDGCSGVWRAYVEAHGAEEFQPLGTRVRSAHPQAGPS